MDKRRELDAKIAEKVFGLNVVAHDWPCGYAPDGGRYEAALYRNEEEVLSWFNQRGPVYCDVEGGWPPQVDKRDRYDRGLGHARAIVEPVPFYSSNWIDAGKVIERMRQIWRTDDSEEFYWQFTDCQEYGWRVDIMYSHHDGDVAVHTAIFESLALAVCVTALEFAESGNSG